jgi:hypothetical protein
MTTNRKHTLAIALLLTTGAAVATAGPASARGGNDAVTAHGQCSAHATWKLKAKADDSQLEVEFEVDSNQAGQDWTVRLTDNGNKFFGGTRTTTGPSGSFSVTKFATNASGSDVIRARAVHNDQVCKGSVTVT